MIITHDNIKITVKWRKSAISGLAGTIYYQISSGQDTKQIFTPYKIYHDEWDVKKQRVMPNGNAGRAIPVKIAQTRIRFDLARLQHCAALGEKASDIVAAYDSLKSDHLFFAVMEDMVESLLDRGKFNTAKNYVSSYRSFFSFCQNYSLSFSDLTPDLMENYEGMLKQRKVRGNTSSFYMRTIRSVYYKAVDQSLAADQRPFRRVFTGIAKTAKRAISAKEIKRIKALDLQSRPALDIARDAFLFSFYGRGMSLIDVAHISAADIKDGYIIYNRSKTSQTLRVKVLPQMQEIINKYRSKDAPYLLPLLKTKDCQGGREYDAAIRRINNNLKKVAAMARIDITLTTYVARHSWASICKTKNVPIAVISDGLGHDSVSTTEIYLKSIDQSVIDAANELVTRGL